MNSLTARNHPALDFVRALVRAHRAFERATEREIRRHGLTPPQFDVLAALGNTEGLPLSEIGKKTLVTAGNITGIVDRLEAAGLVERKRCTKDRRIVYAALTPEGDALFQRIFPMQVEWSDRVLSRELTPEQRDTLALELRRLAALFQQEADQPEGETPPSSTSGAQP